MSSLNYRKALKTVNVFLLGSSALSTSSAKKHVLLVCRTLLASFRSTVVNLDEAVWKTFVCEFPVFFSVETGSKYSAAHVRGIGENGESEAWRTIS